MVVSWLVPVCGGCLPLLCLLVVYRYSSCHEFLGLQTLQHGHAHASREPCTLATRVHCYDVIGVHSWMSTSTVSACRLPILQLSWVPWSSNYRRCAVCLHEYISQHRRRHLYCSCSTSGPVTAWMGDRRLTGIPSRYIPNHLGPLSLPSLRVLAYHEYIGQHRGRHLPDCLRSLLPYLLRGQSINQ